MLHGLLALLSYLVNNNIKVASCSAWLQVLNCVFDQQLLELCAKFVGTMGRAYVV